MLLNVDKINWSYRKEFNLKEDRDFVMQTISKGNGIVKFHKHYNNGFKRKTNCFYYLF